MVENEFKPASREANMDVLKNADKDIVPSSIGVAAALKDMYRAIIDSTPPSAMQSGIVFLRENTEKKKITTANTIANTKKTATQISSV